MKYWAIIAAIFFALLFSIYSTHANADPQRAAAAPASYDAVKETALRKYLETSNEALQKYSARDSELIAAFDAISEREISKLRNSNPGAFAQWLGALKAKDAGKAAELERAVPEIAGYVEARRLAREEYLEKTRDAFALYEEADRKAFEERNRTIEAYGKKAAGRTGSTAQAQN